MAPAPGKTRKRRYAEIARAGFNFVIGGNGVTSTDLHGRALKAAAANGLRYVITDAILQNAINGEVSRDRRQAVSKRLKRLVGEHGGHPALAGFNLYDEPKSRLFGVLGHARRELKRLAPGELAYVNLWPSYAAKEGQASTHAEASREAQEAAERREVRRGWFFRRFFGLQ